MLTSVGAPPQVRKAIALLWGTALFGAVETAYMYINPDPEIADIVGYLAAWTALLALGYCTVIHYASRRRNWARYALLAFCVLGTLLYFAFPSESGEPWWSMATAVVSTALEAIALFWLFTGAGAQWYRSRSAA